MTATAESAQTVGREVPLDPGDVVGAEDASRWQVVRHIADGGFSSVYEVQPATPATRIRHGPAHRALKCLWGTPAELTTIGGEAAKMAAVEGHDNVLGMIASFRFGLPAQPHADHADHADHAGLVLELATEDLPRFAARVHPSERAWAAVFEQIAAGLDHIHARRVVHGDIKPTNMLRVDGRFAVADFGVSAPLEATHSAGIGPSRTIAFWPPESAGQGTAGPDGVRLPPVGGWRATRQSDVWALAVSMHRMLTGRHITPGTTPEQQYEFVCLGKYTLDDRLGPGWRRLLADCLVHEADQRVVSTAADLRARLSELALTDQYAGVPWPDGGPRVVAVLDLGRPSALPAARASLDPAVASTGASATSAPASAAPGSAPATPAPATPAAVAPAAAGSADVGATATPASAATGPAGAGAAAVPTTPSGPAAAESRATTLADAVAVPAADPAAPGADPGTATTPGSGRATQLTSPGAGADPVPAPRGDPAHLADRRNDATPAAAGRGEVLVLYLTREGGRAHGAVLPGGGLLLDAVRHLTDVAVPSLAQQVRDSQRALVRRLDEQERLRAAGAAERLPDDAGPSTTIVDPNDADLTRELSVADAIRQRDQVLRDRDRLRQQYVDLAHRLDRLERDRAQSERTGLDSPTAVLRAAVPGRAADRSTAPIRTVRPAAQPRRRRRHPVLRTVLLLLVLLVVAAALGGLAVVLATGRDPVDVLHQAVQPILDWAG